MTRLSQSIALGCALIAGVAVLPACMEVSGEDDPALEETQSIAGIDIDILKHWDADANQLPEGLAVDRSGRIYVSMAFLGQIWRIDRNLSQQTIAQLPTGGFAVLGVAVDSDYNVYAGDATFDPATHGVYKITPTGAISRLPGSDAIGLPNGLVVKDSYVYVSDSINGAIWRIPRSGGGSAAVWSQSSLFLGDNSAPPPFPVGINGLAYSSGAWYATNSEMGTLLKVPVTSSGGAGTPVVLKQDPLLGACDGLAIDPTNGRFYIAVLAQSTIVTIPKTLGPVEVIADADNNIDFPSSVAFNTLDPDDLYAVNFSVGPLFGAPRGFGPALLEIEAPY